MNRFELVSKYKDRGIYIPTAATQQSAGYDLSAAEDVIIPSLTKTSNDYLSIQGFPQYENSTLGQGLEESLKTLGMRPTLVPTGVKVKLGEDYYLSVSARSSLPLKSLLIVANAPGIIDADYYNNEDNEGEIFIQLLNLSPFDIKIEKGERIAQGIILKYYRTDEERTTQERESGMGSTDELRR